MTICNQLTNFLLVALMATVLVSCGGSTDLPPERPAGTVTGHAIDGAISGGIVSIFSFENGVPGERLGGGTTDASGGFSVQLHAPSQIVLVEVTGGSYVEEASGETVSLNDGEKLRSLAYYQLEQTVSTNVTPLTNMGTALAEYKIANGMATQQAIDEAFTTVQEFFGLDSRGATSINITAESPSPVTLGEEVLYGFYMAGMSSWTAQASRDNRVPPHTTYTSAGLAQIMYDDIRANGLLDGQGFNNDNTQLVPLAMGAVPLSADEYRSAFSIHMLAMANNLTVNKTGLGMAELTAAADAIAGKTSDNTALLNTSQTLNIDLRDISITLAQSKNGYYHDTFDFELVVDGILGIDQISILVDDVPAVDMQAIVGDPLVPPIQIDTTKYTDDLHTISVQVWNALGNTDTLEFDAQFDNTGPQITLSGDIPTLTNMASQPLSYIVEASFAGLQSVETSLNGSTVEVTPSGNQWETTLALVDGENALSIVATDEAGNQTTVSETIYLDQIPPVIDTSSGHSEVQFSNGDGTSYTGMLANDNITINSDPLYLETDYIGFNTYGKVLSRNTLDSDNMPYFAFSVSDERTTGAATRAEDLSVRLQYQRSETVLNDWHELPVQPQCVSDENTTVTTCEYLIPLLSELLDPPQDVISFWHETSPQEPHYLRIELGDGAGNTDTVEFTFKVDFYVPPIPVCAEQQSCTQGELVVNDLDPFTGKFDTRDTLIETILATTNYTFQNPSSKAIFINLSGDTGHTVTQTQEQEIRVHQVKKNTDISWQVQPIFPLTPNGVCPVPGSAYTVGTGAGEVSLQNWDGEQWVNMTPPVIDEPPYFLMNDTLPEITSQTNNATEIDAFSIHETLPDTFVNNRAYDYDADYRVLDADSGFLGYAKVINWKYINVNNNRVLNQCVLNWVFSETVTESWASVDGPRDDVSELPPQTLSFDTSDYVVSIGGNTLQANNGWYLIPAGAEVVITKEVSTDTTPNLVVQEADFTADASYTAASVRDLSYSWDIDRNLTITAVHDASAANIDAMSTRETQSLTGVRTYTISRP